jgi:hypothetical protein
METIDLGKSLTEEDKLDDRALVGVAAELVSIVLNIAVPALLAPQRNTAESLGRWMIGYLAREVLKLSYSRIGTAMGCDHTTIMYGHTNVGRCRDADANFAAVLELTGERLRRECEERFGYLLESHDAVRGKVTPAATQSWLERAQRLANV